MAFQEGITPLTAGELNKRVASHDGTTGLTLVAGYFSPGSSPTWTGVGASAVTRNGVGDYTITWDGAFTQVLSVQPQVEETDEAKLKNRAARVHASTNSTGRIKIFDTSTGALTDDVGAVTVIAVGVS